MGVSIKNGPRTVNPVDTPKVVQQDTNSPQAEFERFTNLTRKLTQVPKSEVDEKRKG
ncbi:MAG: hypothetical protein QOJ29_2639 [Thermoleophilaceae bacterium]|jgi:hypothetical protein|nr:hypothetical protein [Thermoleophilaceae bacterium]